jgi:hypothetical protein
VVTWVRFDDKAPRHPKIAPLDDATFRLWFEAICWSNEYGTDGAVAPDQLRSIRNGTPRRAALLVARRLWHTVDSPIDCPSAKCPPRSPVGWTIHDYHDFQPTAEKVAADKAAKAERQARWSERRKQDASHRASRDASKDDAPSPSPSPPRRGKGTADAVPEARPAADHAYGAADRSKIRCPTCGNALESAYHRNNCQTLTA